MSNAWETDYYYQAPFAEVVARIAGTNARDRHRHLAMCEKAFAGCSFLDDSIRVAAAKVLVALLPESLASLRRWLAKPRTKRACEIHFSLFCFLHEVQNWPRLASVKRSVLDMVAAYLMAAESDTAQSAWMAGDLLGDHWKLRDSLPVLINVALAAKHAAGRAAAIHGLAEALTRSSNGDRKRIKVTLEQIAVTDKSERVRRAAKRILDDAPMVKA